MQKFEVSSVRRACRATEGPVTVTVSNVGVAVVERFDLRVT